MQLAISGRNYDINDRTRSLIESKLKKVEKMIELRPG